MEKFKNKIWLSSPTMHGDELKYMKEAYEKIGCLQSEKTLTK
ncbi:MAG: hypothetical protein ACLSBH_11180 [Coprobacillus cateniformis]